MLSSWKNCPLPLIFWVKSRWRHSKQAVFRLPQQCFLAAPLRIWTLMRSTKTYHPGLTCGFIQKEWYPRGTLIRCSNRLNRFHGDTEGAFILLSFIRMADLHPQPQGKAQTPSGGNDRRKPLTYLLNYIYGTWFLFFSMFCPTPTPTPPVHQQIILVLLTVSSCSKFISGAILLIIDAAWIKWMVITVETLPIRPAMI